MSIRTEMDARSHINALPGELLSHIFESHVAPPPSARVGDKEWREHVKSRLKEVTGLQLICRHWRDVAQATPYLWTAFDTTGELDSKFLQLWHLSLERSGSLPLELHANGSLSPCAHLVLKSKRVRWLNWGAFSGNHQDVLVHLDGLETLQFNEFYSSAGANPQTELSKLACYSPRLRSLQVRWCTWAPSEVFKNLTSLRLVRYSGKTSDVLLWLKRCPVLQSMIFERPEDENLVDLDSIGVVSVPNLRELMLSRVPWNQLAAIVPRLDLSPATFVEVHNWKHGSGKVDCARMLGTSQLHRMVFISHCNALVVGPDSGISFSKEKLGEKERSLRWTSELSDMVSTANIQELWLSASMQLSQDLGALLAMLPGLTSIHIDSTQLKEVLQNFRRGRDPQGPAPCPELKVIHVFVQSAAAVMPFLRQYESLLEKLGHLDIVIEHLPNCEVDLKALYSVRRPQLLSRVRVVQCEQKPQAEVPAPFTGLLDSDEDDD
ncbi:hypothetical protein POSPLADRAFT_1156255 [Postia placenta MAD-698-R-SB12]|uniref:Uncharacterized protein n=1 Tax=Postia placenta MAD-698-R-SB12 TaxID=670580 RepID=A0A1X6MMW6_9APHY|nr:hypothetical protein POSPLADRAFT_1156255 [Postia placenta MAD-698-R-SB12]OSX57771.1 hypothetical protein POSPLADRAFT_1156255 [Postia placenta MAD-698-R-SB12]